MCSGRLPLFAEYEQAVLHQSVNREPIGIEAIERRHGTELASLISDCPAKSPMERPSVVANLLKHDSAVRSNCDLPKVTSSRPWRRLGSVYRRLLAIDRYRTRLQVTKIGQVSGLGRFPVRAAVYHPSGGHSFVHSDGSNGRRKSLPNRRCRFQVFHHRSRQVYGEYRVTITV